MEAMCALIPEVGMSYHEVRFGSWLCENAKTPEGDRRSYSSNTVLALKLADVLNSENELKNLILVTFRLFGFYTARVKLGSGPV
jgi:hypothetical protein